MSETLFELAAGGRHAAQSAGTTPVERVHPQVVAVMQELGIDLSDRTPRMLTMDLAQWADIVITMGCGESCPVIPGKKYIDWDLPDPKDRPIERVREIRDEISLRVDDLVRSLDERDVEKRLVS